MYRHILFCPSYFSSVMYFNFNPLNAKLNPICHLLALLGAHHILHVRRVRVNLHSSRVWNETVVRFTNHFIL